MGDVVVLCYHALSERWPATLNVHPSRFEQQIELLAQRGYEGSTFTEALERPSRKKRLVITFDDAFRSVLDRGVPILERLGFPGTIFAVSRFAEQGKPLAWDGIEQWQEGPHAHELASLDWGQLRDLAQRGWEIGSHTTSHPHLTRLADRELAVELARSREACSAAVGHECSSVAYPYGDVDARVVAAARSAGYRTGAALPDRLNRGRMLEWPRIGVFWGDDLRRFKLKVSRAVRAARIVARR